MRTLRLVSVALIVLSFGAPAGAMFAAPTPAPIDRLIANTTAYIKEKPNDAHAYYTLARIHYLAFVNKSKLVPTFGRETLPKVAEDWQGADIVYVARYRRAEELALKESGHDSTDAVPSEERQRFYQSVEQKRKELEEEGWAPEKLAENDLFEHAGAALENFQTAIKLDSQNALYHLGLASLLEQYVEFLGEIEAEQVPQQFRKFLLSEAKDIYYKAYCLSIKKDLKHRYLPIAGLQSLVGYEAGNAYVRLSENLGDISKGEEKTIAKVKRNVQKLDSLPMGAITPIVFSLEKHTSLAGLLAPDVKVRFDLDGDGVSELWPWVKPGTGILVWDPAGEGVITSGRQMFGSVTWWLFFEDGYHALDALDNNRDGFLAAGELEGIRVWFDENRDGISLPAEVVSLADLGIISISTKPSGKDSGCPTSASGITFSDGRTLPTYDWLTSPEKEESGLSR
ncbi:MAG: hypothetical protein ACYST6_12975 [Planctomycetota bacterium]|jgi:hypothetical protein